MFLKSGKNPRKRNDEKFTFTNIEAWTPTTLLQANSLKNDLPRCLIKFLVASYNCKKTFILQNMFHGLLVKLEQRQTRNINKKENLNTFSNKFQIRFCALSFIQCILDYIDRSSREVCHWKREISFYYKVDLYSNDFCFISSFGFVQLTVAVKLMSLQPYDRKYFFRGNRKPMHILNL